MSPQPYQIEYLNITAELISATYKAKVIKLKLDGDSLQSWVYFISFMDSLKIILSKFKETYMFLMDYTYIRGRDLPYYA